MKQIIGLYDFRRAFEELRPSNFSYEGLEVLFDYLEEYEESTGEELELDVIAICCDYSEDTWKGVVLNYPIELPERDEGLDDDEYEAECKAAVEEYLNNNTMLVGETSYGFVYANF